MKLVCESIEELVSESMFTNRTQQLVGVLQNMFYDWKKLGYVPSLLNYKDEISYPILLILKKIKIIIPTAAGRDSTYKWNESDTPNFSSIAQRVLNKYASKERDERLKKTGGQEQFRKIISPQARVTNKDKHGNFLDSKYKHI